MATPTSTAGASVAPSSTLSSVSKPTHRYTTEIAQMCFVFHGEPKEVEEEVVQYLEEVVRAQLGEVIQQARELATRRRGGRHLTVDDFIFLLRHDREKLLRIRNYLSGQDVRKKVKESERDGDEELPDNNADEDERTLKATKMQIKIPWDLSGMFGEYLSEETEGADAEEVEAFEMSKPRLKAADELTANMTKEQYLHYADCAQASFVYRKSQKFRQFVSLSLALDAGAFTEEVMDVLAFLAFEMVRALCEAAVRVKRSLALERAGMALKVLRADREKEKKEEEKRVRKGKGKRKAKGSIEEEGDEAQEEEKNESAAATPASSKEKDKTSAASPSSETTASKKRKTTTTSAEAASPPSISTPCPLLPPTSLFSEPLLIPDPVPSASTPKPATAESILEGLVSEALEVQAKGAPLTLAEVNAGYAALGMHRRGDKKKGMRNFRGGVGRGVGRFV